MDTKKNPLFKGSGVLCTLIVGLAAKKSESKTVLMLKPDL